ncbi:MAG: ADOP family duplicated permease [Gemmatimonadales bacterium]
MKRAWWQFGRRGDELREEMESHLAMAIEERVARGEPLAEATEAARQQFGNRELIRATSREMWGVVWFEQLGLDLRYGLRKLRLGPGFTAVAALSLAIGIGATVTMYAVVDAADIRGLPYPHAERLYVLAATSTFRTTLNGPGRTMQMPVSPATFSDWRNSSHSFDAMTRVAPTLLYWPHDDDAEPLSLAAVGADFFPMLGAKAAIGRSIVSADTSADAPGVIVLSHAFWRERFGADRNVVGQRLQLTANDSLGAPRETYTVIGVMGEQMDFPAATQGWVAERSGLQSPANVLARLGEARTVDAAVEELSATGFSTHEPAFPFRHAGVRATPLRAWLQQAGSKESFSIESAKGRAVRLGIVLCVLLIAVFNVGNLLLARSAARDHEMTIRTSLGASRARLAQQIIVEGGCLAFAGAVIGVALARWGIGLIGALGEFEHMGVVPVLDTRVLAFALTLTMLVALGTGFIPILSLLGDRGPVRTRESPVASQGRLRSRVQGVLLVGQIGAALTLLTGAGLLAKELVRLEKQGFDFNPTNIVWFPHLHGTAQRDPLARGRFRDDALARLARAPGVSSVSAFEEFGDDGFYPLGAPDLAEKTYDLHMDAAVSAGFIRNLGIRLIRGRDFSAVDYSTRAPVAILSTSAAERFWPGEDPLGKQVVVPPGIMMMRQGKKGDSLIVTVIGVAGNPRFSGILGPPPLTLLRPSSDSAGLAQFLVRTAHDPEESMPGLLRAVRALQGASAVRGEYGTAQKFGIDRQLAEQKLTTRALVAFAAVALLLATLGIHGLVAFAVTQRTREIGIRMALGAASESVLLLVTRRTLALAIAGTALGVAGSFALTRLLRAMLYGTSPTDPTVFFGAAALLATIVFVAGYLPARRATRVDPMVALRVD